MLLIGVTPSGRTELNQQVHHDYLEAVMRAGALPLVFPMTSDEKILTAALNLVDGLLVTGGVDIHPKYFGEEILPCCGTICKERDEMEAFVLRYALDKDMPILCICRGMQFINCVEGGALYQDIPEQYSKELVHSRSDTPNDPVHAASIKENTLLHKIVGKTTLEINSRHHQAVSTPAPNCVVNAVAPDGTVEGIEFPEKGFTLAVQWHPESLSDRYEDHQKIFDAFVRYCEENK